MSLTFLEPADVGKALGLTPEAVRVMVKQGRLRVVGRTPRGLNLFRPEEVERLRQVRAARRKEQQRRREPVRRRSRCEGVV